MYRYNFGTRNICTCIGTTSQQGRDREVGVPSVVTKPCHSSGNNAVDQKRWELMKTIEDKSSDMGADQRSV